VIVGSGDAPKVITGSEFANSKSIPRHAAVKVNIPKRFVASDLKPVPRYTSLSGPLD